jgi:3-deoxy-manno-octulosonate cytidylyltransferase (CMP-KDO synthetase)
VLHLNVRPVRLPEQTRLTSVAIIPARYQSTRLPGKPLLDLEGFPMIARVYDRVAATPGLTQVMVATDDPRVHEAMVRHAGEASCRMTSAEHRTGTDRLAEVARTLDCDLVVNVQGDEPLIEPAMIAEALSAFDGDGDGTGDGRGNAAVEMSTLCKPITDEQEFQNPNLVKVVTALDGFALYFSRAPIPYNRATANRGAPPRAFKHIGMYVYRRETLLKLASLPPTPLESAELLEQLRALEHGIRIKAVETRYDSFGVDTPEDLAHVRHLLARDVPRA